MIKLRLIQNYDPAYGFSLLKRDQVVFISTYELLSKDSVISLFNEARQLIGTIGRLEISDYLIMEV